MLYAWPAAALAAHQGRASTCGPSANHACVIRSHPSFPRARNGRDCAARMPLQGLMGCTSGRAQRRSRSVPQQRPSAAYTAHPPDPKQLDRSHIRAPRRLCSGLPPPMRALWLRCSARAAVLMLLLSVL